MVIRMDGDPNLCLFLLSLSSLLLISPADAIGQADSMRRVELGRQPTSKYSPVKRKEDSLLSRGGALGHVAYLELLE